MRVVGDVDASGDRVGVLWSPSLVRLPVVWSGVGASESAAADLVSLPPLSLLIKGSSGTARGTLMAARSLSEGSSGRVGRLLRSWWFARAVCGTGGIVLEI